MKKARVKIDDVSQGCNGCDEKMTLGSEVVYLKDSWYCSKSCAIEGGGGYSAIIEECFFDDGEWYISAEDGDYFEREYKEKDEDLYKWRNAEIIEGK